MTTVAPTTTAPATTTPSAAADPMAVLSGNFDTFLTLLTTQLKNQDPTAPMDSNQFTQQLVQFSQVEQQINTNDNLKSIIAQGQNTQGAYAVSYLGKSVTVTNGDAPLTNSQANWNYALAAPSAGTTLTVTDANGNVVYSQQGETTAGMHAFSWNGQSLTGVQMPDGTYSLSVSAQGANGQTVQSAVSSTGPVSEVDMSGATPLLMVGAMKIPLTSVSQVGD
jgi:flagellar basal-body rod modification protein FlgD